LEAFVTQIGDFGIVAAPAASPSEKKFFFRAPAALA
jgi:hypothetical protein